MKVIFTSVFCLVFSIGLLAQTPQYYNYNTTSGGNAFPFSVTAGKTVQWIFLAGEINQPSPAPSGLITTVYFRVANASITYTDITVRMGDTTLTSLPTGAFYTGPLDTVYHRTNIQLTSTNNWLVITLDRPFFYNNTRSLIVEGSQCGCSATGMTIYNTTLSGNRRTYNQTAGGCNYIFQGQSGTLVNFGIDIAPPPPPPNRALLLPTPGVNTNYVLIPHQGSMIGFPNVTIEGWVKIGGSTTPNTVLNKGGSSFDYQLGINGTTTNPFFRAQSTIVIATTMTVSVGVWTHLAVTFDGTTVRFYKNGEMQFSQVAAAVLGSSTNEMRIGRGGSDPGSGNLEEVRLWSIARTPGAIDSNKCRKYFPLNTPGLKAIWHFDSTYTDSVSGYNGTPTSGLVGFDTLTFPHPTMNCNLVGIQQTGNEIPSSYFLSQNYPNPFNPMTTIEFSLPKGEFVEITIFDVTGREVATIVQDPFQAGTYKVTFDATSLSSGVYFYKLTAGNFTDTKKMLLVK
jgi:hypothetical protein